MRVETASPARYRLIGMGMGMGMGIGISIDNDIDNGIASTSHRHRIDIGTDIASLCIDRSAHVVAPTDGGG
jgi:hypothetical protein